MLSMLFLLALSHAAPVGAGQPVVVEVDCDAGESLAPALRKVQGFPGATVRIHGTCVGTFVVRTDSLQLVGDSPQESILAGPAPVEGAAVLEVRDARDVMIRGLKIRGGNAGVSFQNSPGGTVLESEFESNGVGIFFRHSDDGFVRDSDVHDNEIGLIVDFRSSVGVQSSSFRDQTVEGVSAFTYSALSLIDSEVTGSGQAGATARGVSQVALLNSTLSENGDTHGLADDRSRLQIFSGVVLGSATDTTPFAVLLDDDAALQSGIAAEFHGDIVASGDSYVELGNVDVHGQIRAENFSRVLLFQTQLAMVATCESGADLTCTGGAAAATSACPSSASCAAPASPAVQPNRPAHFPRPELRQRTSPPYGQPRARRP